MLSNFDAVARDRFKSLFLVIVLRSVNSCLVSDVAPTEARDAATCSLSNVIY